MKRGFTLIELLVVVAIIGVMIAGALTNVSSGRDAARARDAARGVSQMVHYANALALLRQRPVVLTYTTVRDSDDVPSARIEVQLSGEAMAVAAQAEPADPIYREVDGQDTTHAGAEAAREEAAENEGEIGGTTVAEKAGVFFTRKILDPDELAKEDAMREFEGMAFEVETLGEDGAVVDENTARSLAEQAQGILNNRVTAIKAWSNTQGEIDTSKTVTAEEEEKKKSESEPLRIIFETNGNCQPHRVTLRTSSETAKDEGVPITISRSCKVVIGDPEEKKR